MVRDNEFYAEQSRITDPGKMNSRLEVLPTDLAGLQRLVREIVLHYRADDPASHGIPEERLSEIDARYSEAMLDRLFALDGRPLTEQREPKGRLLGCCRDFTVLFLTMARRASVPARARVGFATYFIAGFGLDHEVAEVWDAAEERWRLVDAELHDEHVDPNDGQRVDPLDVPRHRFLVAGAAWLASRSGEADPETFVVHPDLDEEVLRGWPYLAHNLVHDLAALNKMEMLLWDVWGLMHEGRPSDLALLDRVARATVSPDTSVDELRQLYNDPRVRVPGTLTSYSPARNGPVQFSP